MKAVHRKGVEADIMEIVKNQDKTEALHQTISQLEENIKELDTKARKLDIVRPLMIGCGVCFFCGAILGATLFCGFRPAPKPRIRYYTHRCSYYFKHAA